eukprot:Platyproteum_vivax@DN7623_c1_g1_i11.p1
MQITQRAFRKFVESSEYSIRSDTSTVQIATDTNGCCRRLNLLWNYTQTAVIDINIGIIIVVQYLYCDGPNTYLNHQKIVATFLLRQGKQHVERNFGVFVEDG